MTFGVEAVTVAFGRTTALADVTVEVPDGGVVAVVGGDGAGKSTLLRTLVRELSPQSGQVHAPRKAELGFLPASAGSWPSLTVAQNIDFAAGAYGVTGARLRERRDVLLANADLTGAADRLASQLSGGMRRKLGFCMAIVHQPLLVVLDEPSTGVDPVSRIDLWRMIAETAAAGAAVIMTTTYLDEAERAGRLIVLDNGRVLVQGSYDEVRAGFDGTVTSGDRATRPEWSWRRGHQRHEYWPPGQAPSGSTVVQPDLEDITIALTLRDRLGSTAGVSS